MHRVCGFDKYDTIWYCWYSQLDKEVVVTLTLQRVSHECGGDERAG